MGAQDSQQIIVKRRDSLLTTSSGYTNYRGILNLIIILLVLSNARAALENVIKYGILVDPMSWIIFFREWSQHTPSLLVTLALSFPIMISLVVEKVLAQPDQQHPSPLKSKKASHLDNHHSNHNLNISTLKLVAKATIVLNLFSCIALPAIVLYTQDTHPISASAALMLVSIVFLKLVSYHMMNFWARDLRRPEKAQSRTTKGFLRSYTPPRVEFAKETQQGPPSPSKVLTQYPNNLTVQDLAMFMVYPTLCYDLEYAFTERIRKRFLVRRIAEVIILLQMDIALVQQWLVPTVNNSLVPLKQMQFSHMLERLLKLAIPNHIIWLIWFYLFFHSFLNIVAELTRFADREFYRDWWNSESVYYFWSNWNIPVHKWCARHLYIPLISLGYSKCQASTAVFFVSAFFHEYLVSVPLKMFRMWAFTGMLIQLPWARFVSNHFNNTLANVAVWVSLIIGQPLCILMYYHDYYVINRALTSR